jgi:hypothetical protein
LVSGEDFDRDPGPLGLQSIDIAIGRLESSLLTASAGAIARGKQAGGCVAGTREGVVDVVRVRVRVRMMVMGMGMMGMMKALSSPVGAGDRGHWR